MPSKWLIYRAAPACPLIQAPADLAHCLQSL